MIWLLSVILATSPCATAKGKRKAAKAPAEFKLGLPKVGTCDVPKGDKTVYLIKQWHLAPKTITKSFREKYPQEKNQTVIYKALSEAVKKKKLQLVIAEGCEGEIDENFRTSFNGWDFESLKKESQRKGFEKVVTHVPLKLEARWGDQVKTLCGDSQALIQEGNLRLSNLRGWLGFRMRLVEFADNPEKLALWTDSVAPLLKLPKDTPVDQLQAGVKQQLKTELDLFRKSLTDRNDVFVKALQTEGLDYQNAAIVIGGLHADDLKAKLQAAGMHCEVYEPPGYQREDERLIQEFERGL